MNAMGHEQAERDSHPGSVRTGFIASELIDPI
jgi:hypothetical protein